MSEQVQVVGIDMVTSVNDTLWLVTARSGSKGIPNKNIQKLAGFPLLAIRTISARGLGDLILSTDSPEYASIGEEYGAEVPFLRPVDLASDSASSIDVALHSIQELAKLGRTYKFLGLLEPTSPFISRKQLKEALSIFKNDSEAENLVSVREVKPHPKFIQDNTKYLSDLAANLKQSAHQGRQKFPTQITPSGGIYITKIEAFKKNLSFYTDKTMGYFVDSYSGLEIDSQMDLVWAEFLVEKSLVDMKSLWADD